MVDRYRRQSPLAALHLDAQVTPDDDKSGAGVSIVERQGQRQIALRGPSTDPAFVAAIEATLGTSLPIIPCTANGDSDGVHIMWMGPDEWLVIAPDDNDAVAENLNRACAGIHSAVVDVSESRTIVRLSGLNARHTLSKGCSLDLHPRQFGRNKVVNTLLAQAHITLHQISDTTDRGCEYDIYVHRSFATYLWLWFEDATREYGLSIKSG